MSPLHRARAFGLWMNQVGSTLHKFSTFASQKEIGVQPSLLIEFAKNIGGYARKPSSPLHR